MNEYVMRRAMADGDELIRGKSKESVAYRLTLTRQALGLTQVEFGQRAGIAKNTYNQYETGTNMPNLESARKIKLTYNVSLDWIYDGDNSGLPYDLVDAIKKIYDLRTKTTLR